MEDTNTLFHFDSPKEQSSYIKVIGVGGGGGNAVNHMFNQGINGVDFIVCNTDLKALDDSPVPNKITLGKLGLGAGNKPEKARLAAENQADDIRAMLSHNTQMLFITAGMGGGTGTGAAPAIAEIAKNIELECEDNKKILVVAIVTTPFSWEGPIRRKQAAAGIAELRKHVDAILVINNDKLRSLGNQGLSQGFAKANDILYNAAKSISELITGNGLINLDFQDVNTVMENSGTALMGTGCKGGENRAHDAIEEASTSFLLDDSDISGAKDILLYFNYSSQHEITYDELDEITAYLCDLTGSMNDEGANVIWGCGVDDKLNDELKITLIATGFEHRNKPDAHKTNEVESRVIELETAPVEQPISQPVDLSVPVQEPYIQEAPAESAPVEQPQDTIGRRVFTLEPEPVAESSAPKAEPQPATVAELEPVRVEVAATTAMEAPQPAPACQTYSDPFAQMPASQPAQQPARPSEEERLFTNYVQNREERMRILHDLLRNNPNGAAIVENMTTEQLTNEPIYQTPDSQSPVATQTVSTANGMKQNNFLFNLAD